MRLLLILLFASSSSLLYSQTKQVWEIGAMTGASVYHGDLAPDFSMQAPGFNASVFVRHNLDSRLCLRAAATFGSISASDAKSENSFRKARNLSFHSTIFEGSLAVEFNFLPFHFKSTRRDRNRFTPYMVAGVGVFYHNPKTWYDGKAYELQALGTEGQAPGNEYSLVQPAFILGGGFKIDVTDYFGIIVEGSTRILFFDYLDDVSGEYASPDVIQAHRGSLGAAAVALSDRSGGVMGGAGRQRGNSKTNDGYTMFSVGIVYTIYNAVCPAY